MRRHRLGLFRDLVLTSGIALAVAFGQTLSPAPASAYMIGPNGPYPSQIVYYKIDPTFTSTGFLTSVLYESEQNWKSQDLTVSAQLYNDQVLGAQHVVDAHPLDASLNAQATVGCSQGFACEMTFSSTGRQWNTTDQLRASPWIDFRTVAVHEFGHMLGANHSSDQPGTDPGPIAGDTDNLPVMYPYQNAGDHRRYPREDDFKASRRRVAESRTTRISQPILRSSMPPEPVPAPRSRSGTAGV